MYKKLKTFLFRYQYRDIEIQAESEEKARIEMSRLVELYKARANVYLEVGKLVSVTEV